MVTPDTSLPAKGGKLCCRMMCWFAKKEKKKITGKVWFLQSSSCAKWAERGVFSISATSWKWKCHIFQHFLSSLVFTFPAHNPLGSLALTGIMGLAWLVLGVLLFNVCVSICSALATLCQHLSWLSKRWWKSTECKTKLLFLRLPPGEV